MEWLVAGASPVLGRRWVEAVENEDETWRCRFLPGEAEELPPADALLLLPGGEAWAARLPSPAPYLFTAGCMLPQADGSLRQAAGLREMLQAWRQAGRIPAAAAARLPEATCRARAALRLLGMPDRLRATVFLPDLLALCAVHPPLTEALSTALYPLAARRHGLDPRQVERSLRLAIESTWERAPLDGLERFFGHSVDPERGKPTNREFLLRMSAYTGEGL